MKHKFVGIVICILLIANISVVLGMPKERVNTNGEGRYFIFEDSSGQREIKYIEIDDKKENDLPKKIITNTNDNLAPNPSFEEGDTMPTGWTSAPNTTGIYTWDSSYAHSGEKSIGVLNLTNSYPYEVLWITSDFIPVDTTEHSYRLTAWFKFVDIPAFQYATIRILEYDSNYRLTGSSGRGRGSNNTDWHEITDTTGYDYGHTKYVKLELGQSFNPPYEPNPLIEIRFDDVNFSIWNTLPDAPTITGETHGKIRTLYEYTITTTDADSDNVSYEIKWGDNTTQTTESYHSGENAILTHIWGIVGTYNISVRAIDEHGAKSNWTTLTTTMPYSYNIPFQLFWERLFERFPHAFPILRHLFGY